MSRVLKDSGIYYIGKIPDCWTTAKYKYFCDSRMGETILGENLKDEGIPVYSATQDDVIFGYVEDCSVKLTEGDIVIPARGNSIGCASIIKDEIATCTQTTICSFNIHNIIGKYLYYSIIGLKDEIFKYVGGAIPQITVEQVKNNTIPVPPLAEQQKIADYLDKKCSKINEQKANYEKSIELLKEYKKSLITEAVTKGLDKNVEMKDSGIDWIGETPKNWRILQIKRILKEKLQGYYDADGYVDDGYSLLRITDLLGDGKFSIVNSPYCKYTKTIEQYLLSKGDFCFARTGGAGSFCYIDKDLEKCVFASYLIRFRFNGQYNPFLKYYFLSYSFLEAINSSIHGGVNQNISAEDIKDAYISLPQPEEQKQIADYLDKECSKIDKVIAYREQMIEKLDEYKKSLIYECVTGKKEIK